MDARSGVVTMLGAGKIGRAIALLLLEHGSGYQVRVADQDRDRLAALAELGCETLLVDVTDENSLAAALQGSWAVLNALPFSQAVRVAGLAASLGVHYFDLTEDVRSTQAIRELARGARSVLMPQCGLAPGFIGVVGNDLAQRFDQLLDLHLRVGALPRFPTGALRYNLTWSTEGLINQCIQPCEALVEGRLVEIPALEGLETFALDGVSYEAFNTSGGLGTLTHTLAGHARNVDYKAVRYPGHCAILRLLIDELRLRERPALLKDILETAVPATEQDVVVICASAHGRRAGRLLQQSYSARILGAEVGGRRLSAIQFTTASAICTALDLVATGRLPQAGFVAQEQMALPDFLGNRFGCAFEAGSLEWVQA